MTNKKADGSIIDTYSYTYDVAHNQTSKIDAKGITNYTDDTLNRLETVTEPNNIKKTAYTYDEAGNRATETITAGGNTTVNTYTYNEQNRLAQVVTSVNNATIATTVYTYDNNGNQLTTAVNGKETVSNVYDARNQLISNTTGGIKVQNTYNGEGFRVEKIVSGAIIRYLYEYDKVVLELDGTGNQTGRNVYGTNLLMRTADGTTYNYMYNGHADVTALLRPDGSIAATYYYDAFGNITDTTGTASNTITYAGYQYDKETGLYYLNARMYDPKTARFLQEDTYTGDPNDPLSLNLYTYCHNEPLMYDDPTGHVATYAQITDSYSAYQYSLLLDEQKQGINSTLSNYGSQIAYNQLDIMKKSSDIINSGKGITVTGNNPNTTVTWEDNSKKSLGVWTDFKNNLSESWSNVKRNTADNWNAFKNQISERNNVLKNSFVNLGKGFEDATSSWEGLKNASLGVGTSILNGGLNTTKILITMMSYDPENTWSQIDSEISWTNDKIQTNLVTNPNTFQAFSTFADAAQMAWGAGGLSNIVKGGIRLPSFSNSPSFMEAGTGFRMSDIPYNYSKINILPIKTGASEVAGDVSKLGKYDVGIYNEIKGVSGLDAHHIGQKALMKDFIPDYNPETAPSILVPKVGYTLRGPNGIVSRNTSGITNARDLIARDIMELRRVYPDIPNTQLQKLIDMNKELYPTIRKGR